MKPLRWQTNHEQAEYMRQRKAENVLRTKDNPNELWMAEKLKSTGFRFNRQATWGYRIFDFWCAVLGVAVEVDGLEHDAAYDHYRDEYNFRRSGLVVLRVRNRNETDAARALQLIAKAGTWKERRHILGLDESTKKARRKWTDLPENVSLLDRYLAKITEQSA